MKKRKDSGFTLIELMIVIAVIGILAIVLVPKVGTVKAQAKETGLDTNIRVIQGYVESKIDKWVHNDTSSDNVGTDIINALSGNKSLTNPFTSETKGAKWHDDEDIEDNNPVVVVGDGETLDNELGLEGSIVVTIDGSGPIDDITIEAYNDQGTLINEKTVVIEP